VRGELHIVVVTLVGDMFECKVKLTLLCVAWFVIVFHWSDATRYDDEDDEYLHDSSRSELIDDLENQDLQPFPVRIITVRGRRKIHRLAFGSRRRSKRRRTSWRW